MLLLVCVLLAVAFAFGLKKPIKKAPWVFYILAILVDLLIIYSSQLNLPQWAWKTVVLANGRCLFAFGLFTVVMFLGALKDGSKAKRWLMPIRAELSIIAGILTVGHIVRYLGVYSPRVLSNPASVANGMLASFVVAFILAVLLVVLTVTSFKFVKRHMNASLWKGIQRTAYPFFVLIYAHVLLIMVRPAMMGAENALVSLVVYGAIVAFYVVLRVLRYRSDKLAKVAKTTPHASASSKAVAMDQPVLAE